MKGTLWVLAFAAATLHAQTLPPGQIIPDVATTADPEQRYALYLPAKYNARRAWPLILAFDPGARGIRAVEQYQVAAETFGYIIAASNVSRNGSWPISMDAARAMAVDVTSRFSIDEKRVYTAGMSGGARVAMGVALSSNGLVAGVIASSAGFPDSNPAKAAPFVVFGTAGTEDFNWLEMRSLDKTLTTPHRVVFFEGGHVWLSSELAVEAVEWLDLQAMLAGRMPRDEERITRLCEAHPADCGRPAKVDKDAKKKLDAEEYQERRALGDILDRERELNSPETRAQAFAQLRETWKRLIADTQGPDNTPARRSARRLTRGLLTGVQTRTKDAEYQKLLATYRTPRQGER
jgi:poly(3-hydroxybutyrate) depolymerase